MTARPKSDFAPAEPESGVRLKVVQLPAAYPEGYQRPATWADCHRLRLGTRQNPCGVVSCEHNLLADGYTPTRAKANGSRKLQSRFVIVHDLDGPPPLATCALRCANRGGMTLEAVGDVYGVTRERIRQIEASALRKLRRCGVVVDPPGRLRGHRLDTAGWLREVSGRLWITKGE